MLKKLRIFDFDDTLVTTRSFIKIKKQDGSIVSLTPAQYAQYDKEENDIFDFSDFTSLNEPQIIKWTFKILKNAIAKGGKVIVLTARSPAALRAINDFFESKNIFDLEIVTLGNGDPKAKADAVSDMIEKDGYDFVEFFDDSIRNVDLMKSSIKKNYPNVQVRVHHIKSYAMHEASGRKMSLYERVKPGSFYPPVFDDFLKLVSEYEDHVWVFFDTETTGLQYEDEEVQATQVSCIAYYPNNFETAPRAVPGGEFDIKLALSRATRDAMAREPDDKFSIKNLLLMTDYADDSVKKVNPGIAIYNLEEYLHRMRAASPSGKIVLIAQNSPFDVGILNNLYRRLDVEPPDDEVWDTKAAIDLYFKPVLSLMKKNPDATDEDRDLLSKLVVNGRISSSLGKITSAFNIENKGWHQAIQDVRMTMEMLFRIIQYLRAKSPEIRNTVASKPFDSMAGDPVYGVFSKKSKQKTESIIRQIVCEEVHALLYEGIFDGDIGAGRPAPIPPAVKAAARSKELELANKSGAAGAKKISSAISSAKADVSKMDQKELKDMVDNWGSSPAAPAAPAAPVVKKPGETPAPPTPAPTEAGGSKPEQGPTSATAAAAVLALASKSSGAGARDLAATIKKNPALRAAITTTPGMGELASTVDANLRANGRDPKTAVGDAYRELGRLTSKYGLAEARRIWIACELRWAGRK